MARVISGGRDSVNAPSDAESNAASSILPYARLAWTMTALSLALVVIGVGAFLFALLYGDIRQAPAIHLFFSPVITLTFSLVGALVASHHPRNPIGWIFLAVGFLSALNLDAPIYVLLSQSFALTSALPGIQIAQWMNLWVWIPLMLVPFTFLLLLFPDGHLLSLRWQPIAWAAALGLAGITFAIAFAPAPNVAPIPESNPFGIPGAAAQMELLQNVASVLLAVGFFGSVAALIVRARRSRGIEREQIKWLVFAVVLGILINVAAGIPYWILPNDPNVYDLSIIASGVALCCIVIAAGIAILRYRLYDIDIIVNRTLVYGALTFGIVALYVLLVTALSALLQTSGNLFPSLLATGLVAVLFQPLRERLQRGVNRLTYGERDDPYVVLTRLGAQLESAMEPSAALTQTVETVAAALKLPYVAIALTRDETMQIVAAHGSAPKVVSSFPLSHAGEPIGELVAAPRTPNEGFTPADERLLRDLARQISIAARTVALTGDLEQARLRIVTERGEARRQLGSDLHDGVGHQLVALTRQIERAKSTNSSTEISSEFLADIQQRLVAITTQVRSLAHQLYPPELEVLGLSGALRERVHTYPTFRISIDAPETFPRLPAEIETAAYYIALEALTNVDKHAHANVCSIRLRLSIADAASPLQRLEMDIVDDGRGMTASETHGLGLLSMRARAAEVGGSCDIVPNPGGGTAVRVRIPCVIKAA
jgi:two-component system NarL family sensor kinase